MKKGFIGVGLLIGIAVLITAFYASYEVKQFINKTEDNRLGAVTALTDTIGTFRTNVNATDEALRSTTSTDPGHKHTTSSITGINYVKPISEGGTATTTIPTNGQILIGNGTNYSLNTLTAGAGAVITNATGSITIATAGQYYGDGSDGTVTQNTSTTIIRDMFYDVFTVSSTAIVNTGGYRIFAKTSLTINSNSSISNNGNAGGNGSGQTAGGGGAATTGGTLTAGSAGGAGGAGKGTGIGNGSPGSNGGNTNPSIGVSGSAGGDGASSGGTGGVGGTGGTATAENLAYIIGFPQYATSSATTTLNQTSYADGFVSRSKLSSSAGSGGGGGGANNNTDYGGGGGGGGSTGGVILIVAKTLTNNGTISSNGGDGGAGANSGSPGAAGGGGGGGGGAGGIIILAYNSYSGIGTTTVTQGQGGAGGPLQSPGATGTVGIVGKIYRFIIP